MAFPSALKIIGFFMFFVMVGVLIGRIIIGQLPAMPDLPETRGPYASTVNVALDLAGKPDAVNGGAADSYASRIHFEAPAGYRTRLLHISGDFIAYPRGGSVPSGTSCEIGFGVKSTAQDGSKQVTYPGYQASGYDNSPLWLQGFLLPTAPGTRLTFDVDLRRFLLEADNILLSQPFVALNTTGLAIHMEPTFRVTFVYEK